MYSEFDLKRTAQIIVKIARENNISEEQVRADMKEAMEAGRNDPDPIVQAQWEDFRFVGKEPTIERIAKELDSTPEDVAYSLDAIQSPVSLQEPVYSDGTDNIYIMDQVRDEKNSDEKWAENLTIIQSMKKLNDKEKEIIVRRFFDGRTQMEVAEEIGISQAQVSRLEKNAINHIRRLYK